MQTSLESSAPELCLRERQAGDGRLDLDLRLGEGAAHRYRTIELAFESRGRGALSVRSVRSVKYGKGYPSPLELSFYLSRLAVKLECPRKLGRTP